MPEQQDSRRIMRAETIGVLIIALVILIVVVVRWGGLIPWSAR